ncbi:DNA-binding response regulator [Actinoplanes oblitus]|uniref:DNA-binding response regulator n=1 Tax=Actinoplanes oblitus TaxID=3040509 RepID=A0ABY8W715_9ACTN|nr:DNA-binding response regulator [Actinoplanes oblitus]WIM93137.1 DNA-binding response regulator [Actinoplanes oblitus]
MTVHVAVIDPLPMYRQGVVAALSAIGHRVEAPADPLAWARDARRAVMMLTLATPADWQLLRLLHDVSTAPPVIAMLDDDSATAGVRAVRAGARSVLPRTVTSEVLRRTVEATLDGQAVVPGAVAAALANGAATPPAPDGHASLSPRQLAWLQQLAEGATVAQLATRAGYSERAMFRLLQSLYRDMGVRTRMEAVIRATNLGWLTPGRHP